MRFWKIVQCFSPGVICKRCKMQNAKAAAGGGRTDRRRSLSPSVKRFRNEDGSVTEISQPQSGQKNTRKAVVGTSNSGMNGRQMRSPLETKDI